MDDDQFEASLIKAVSDEQKNVQYLQERYNSDRKKLNDQAIKELFGTDDSITVAINQFRDEITDLQRALVFIKTQNPEEIQKGISVGYLWPARSDYSKPEKYSLEKQIDAFIESRIHKTKTETAVEELIFGKKKPTLIAKTLTNKDIFEKQDLFGIENIYREELKICEEMLLVWEAEMLKFYARSSKEAFFPSQPSKILLNQLQADLAKYQAKVVTHKDNLGKVAYGLTEQEIENEARILAQEEFKKEKEEPQNQSQAQTAGRRAATTQPEPAEPPEKLAQPPAPSRVDQIRQNVAGQQPSFRQDPWGAFGRFGSMLKNRLFGGRAAQGAISGAQSAAGVASKAVGAVKTAATAAKVVSTAGAVGTGGAVAAGAGATAATGGLALVPIVAWTALKGLSKMFTDKEFREKMLAAGTGGLIFLKLFADWLIANGIGAGLGGILGGLAGMVGGPLGVAGGSLAGAVIGAQIQATLLGSLGFGGSGAAVSGASAGGISSGAMAAPASISVGAFTIPAGISSAISGIGGILGGTGISSITAVGIVGGISSVLVSVFLTVAAIAATTPEEKKDEEKPLVTATQPYGYPASGRITSLDAKDDHWSYFYPLSKRFDGGMDIALAGGDVPVYATIDGKAVMVDFIRVDYSKDESLKAKDVGGVVYLQDKEGNYLVEYKHLDESVKNLSVGQEIKRGDLIGKTYPGQLGATSGPHVHYQIVSRGNNLNFSGNSGKCFEGKLLPSEPVQGEPVKRNTTCD